MEATDRDTFKLDSAAPAAERVLARAGAQELGGTLYELAPGHEGLPLHIHHATEEVANVLPAPQLCAPSRASHNWRPATWSRSVAVALAATRSATAVWSRCAT